MKNTKKTVDKRQKDIQKKLSAAVLMLLVSSIMMVSSTYAWFTLSTAPEVKGIQTTIAGNGNLEIALATGETWTDPNSVKTYVGGETQNVNINETWGNLIDLTTGYGIDKLALSPARFVETNENYLSVPQYGADGRVSGLTSAIFASTYKNDSFTRIDGVDRGLRALGISASLTPRQTYFLNALATATSNANKAKNDTSAAIKNSGSVLGQVAVKAAMDGENAVITQSEYDAIESLLNALGGVEAAGDTPAQPGAIQAIDKAIISLIDMHLASSEMQKIDEDDTGLTDDEYVLASGVLNTLTVAENITITETGDAITISNGTDFSQTLNNAAVHALISKYKAIKQAVSEAKLALPTKAEATDATYAWTVISPVMNNLMNMDTGNITVSGKTIEELKDMVYDENHNLQITQEAISLLTGALVIELGAGSGLFYDIASLVGTVQARDVAVLVELGSMGQFNVSATIQSTVNSTVAVIPATVALYKQDKEPTAAGDAANVITDIYGFALDLLFRSNANTNLLLQTTPVDRIYSENTNNEDTMGSGSTMIFTPTAGFDETTAKRLMKSIKLVFIVDGEPAQFVTGKLDVDSFTEVAGKWHVPVRLYTTSTQVVDGVEKTVETLLDAGDSNTTNAQVLAELTKNVVQKLTVVVYLDGDTVTNADVANAATSMIADINLQFASSETLDPMDYSGLKGANTNTDNN